MIIIEGEDEVGASCMNRGGVMIVDDYVGGGRRMYLYWEDNTVDDLDMGHWNQFVENWKRLLSFFLIHYCIQG